MSGGAMDYAFSRIYEAACQVKEYLYDIEAKHASEFEFDATRMHIPPEELRELVISRIMNAYVALRVAEVYAKRVEWIMSGDDGYDDLVKRTDEDLEEVSRAVKFPVKQPTQYVVNETREALVQLMEAVERNGYRDYEAVDDDDPMYKAWHRAKEVLEKTDSK